MFENFNILPPQQLRSNLQIFHDNYKNFLSLSIGQSIGGFQGSSQDFLH